MGSKSPDMEVKKVSNRKDLRWVEAVSRLMDSKYSIPGTRIRFGLDPILSLLPFAGDLATYVISGILIYTMSKHGASGKLVVKMTFNATLDALMGAIPVVGTIFDLFYKANERNLRLLREHYQEGKHTGSGKGLLVIIAMGFIIILVLIIFVIWKLLEWIFNSFPN